MSSDIPRILHVLPSIVLASGGPVTNAVAAAHALQTLGVQVRIVSVDNGVVPQARGPRVVQDSDLPSNLGGLDVELFKTRFPYRLAYSPDLGRYLQESVRQFDVVHINQLFLYPQYAAFTAASRANVPYVVTPHGALDPFLRKRGRLRKRITDLVWQRRMLDRAAALHLTSDDECRLVKDLNIRSPHVVVPNGLDVSAFHTSPDPRGFRHRLALGENDALILNHGRISHKKGLDLLIEAFAQVKRHIPTAHLALVGADDEGLWSQLERLARTLGVERAVHFVGMLRGDDLLAAIAAADIWALPSHTENFGIAVVEAMAAGKSVVTSPHVNIAAGAYAANALVMVDNHPTRIATEILALLEDEQRRVQLGMRAREYASRYDWTVVGRQYLEMYTSIVGDSLPAETTTRPQYQNPDST